MVSPSCVHVGNDSQTDHHIYTGTPLTTLLNTRGLRVEISHRGETFSRDALSMNSQNNAPKWRLGTPESCIKTPLRGAATLAKHQCSEYANAVSMSKNGQRKTQHRLRCGIAHSSKQLGVHPTARMNFAQQSPGNNYKVPMVNRIWLYDDGECMMNAVGRTVYGESMQLRVRKERNDWIEENLMSIPKGPVNVAEEKVPIPVSFLPELLCRREI